MEGLKLGIEGPYYWTLFSSKMVVKDYCVLRTL